MSPLISDGYILVADFAQNNIGELDGKGRDRMAQGQRINRFSFEAL